MLATFCVLLSLSRPTAVTLATLYAWPCPARPRGLASSRHRVLTATRRVHVRDSVADAGAPGARGNRRRARSTPATWRERRPRAFRVEHASTGRRGVSRRRGDADAHARFTVSSASRETPEHGGEFDYLAVNRDADRRTIRRHFARRVDKDEPINVATPGASVPRRC